MVNVSSASNALLLDEAHAACRVDRGVDAVTVETTAVELGQGLHTTLATIAGGVLGLDPARIRVEQRSTEGGPRDRGVFGSGGTYVSGSAVAAAATSLRAAVIERACQLGAVEADDVEVGADAHVRMGERWVGLGALGPLRAVGSYTAPDNALVGGAQFAEVAVDTATGVVTVERVVSVHDVGRVLHPELARSQVEGGVVQGIGSALTERLRHRADGTAVERGFIDHLIPTARHGATVDVIFVEDRPNPDGITGAKGLGEPPILGVAPAVANAIFDATGVRLRELPMTPERVLAGLDAAGKSWLQGAAMGP
jgi:CO/xanthine dehydrogenase Mo-binding subunit